MAKMSISLKLNKVNALVKKCAKYTVSLLQMHVTILVQTCGNLCMVICVCKAITGYDFNSIQSTHVFATDYRNFEDLAGLKYHYMLKARLKFH